MQKVNVRLFDKFPEILSNIKGDIEFDYSKRSLSEKQYTFFSCEDCVSILEPGDLVICQVSNTMTAGVVTKSLGFVEYDEFLRATLERSVKVKNGYRLILTKVHTADLSNQMRFKHSYVAAKHEIESKAEPINEKAFKLALDRL